MKTVKQKLEELYVRVIELKEYGLALEVLDRIKRIEDEEKKQK